MPTTSAVSKEQLREWTERGYFRIDGFAGAEVCAAMLERAREIVHAQAAGEKTAGLILPEANKVREGATDPADSVSKIFKLHRDPVFQEFALQPRLLDLLVELIAPEIDVFLSQFIFKTPGAWGQPWHQDSYYFPFDPPRPVVGVWLAVTQATLENGCLHVLDGSHAEPIHTHVRDRRPGANYGYVEIVDHDTSAAHPVLMQAGDLLVFDSHLMHRSTDNTSKGIRGAMVYHYARAGTVDRAEQATPVNDWMPARRA